MSADAPHIGAEARGLRQASVGTKAIPAQRSGGGPGPAQQDADSARAEGHISLWQAAALRVAAGIVLLAVWQVGATLFAPPYIAGRP